MSSQGLTHLHLFNGSCVKDIEYIPPDVAVFETSKSLLNVLNQNFVILLDGFLKHRSSASPSVASSPPAPAGTC